MSVIIFKKLQPNTRKQTECYISFFVVVKMTFLSSLPIIRVLLSVQVYSGGIGSYALLAMLMAMLQVS